MPGEHPASSPETGDRENLDWQAHSSRSEATATRQERDIQGALFMRLVDAAEDMIYLKDQDLNYLLVNAALAAFFGCSADNALGKNDFQLMPQDLAVACRKSDLLARDSGQVEITVEEIGERVFESRKFPVPLGPDITGVGGLIRDVTSQFRDQAMLREARDRAKKLAAQAIAANRAKAVFLATMSHELRTPLNAILGFAQMLGQAQNHTSTQAGHVRTIVRCGQHLLELINSVLDMAKLESGHEKPRPLDFDLMDFLEDLARMYQPQAQARGITFAVSLDPDLPRTVRGDMLKLRQILINLLSNAFKFTIKGGIVLRVACEKCAGASEIATNRSPSPSVNVIEEFPWMLRFEVHDSGPGIAPLDRERIFESFQQAAEGMRCGGVGLGLAISRDLARLMGGELRLLELEGPGSCFRLEVPIHSGCKDPSEPQSLESFSAMLPVQHPDSKADLPVVCDPGLVPPTLVCSLRQALLRGDVGMLRDLIQEAATHDPEVAAALARLTDRFDYDGLEAILATP